MDIQGAFQALWRQACELAEIQVAAERTALQGARQELEQIQAELGAHCDGLAQQVLTLATERNAALTSRDELEARLTYQAVELDVTRGLLRSVAADGARSRRDIAGTSMGPAPEQEDQLPF